MRIWPSQKDYKVNVSVEYNQLTECWIQLRVISFELKINQEWFCYQIWMTTKLKLNLKRLKNYHLITKEFFSSTKAITTNLSVSLWNVEKSGKKGTITSQTCSSLFGSQCLQAFHSTVFYLICLYHKSWIILNSMEKSLLKTTCSWIWKCTANRSEKTFSIMFQ